MARKTPGEPVEEFTRKGNMANKLERLEAKVAELNDFIETLKTQGFEVSTEVEGYTITVTATPPEGGTEDDEDEDETA